MKKLFVILAILFAASLAVPSAEAGPLRNGARAAGRGVVRVVKRLAHPFRRGC
jgi:hypothetical protein